MYYKKREKGENRNKKKLKAFTYMPDTIIHYDMFPVSTVEVGFCDKLGNNAGR